MSNVFLIALRPNGGPVDDALRVRFDRHPCVSELTRRWVYTTRAAILLADTSDNPVAPIARSGSSVGVGTVRLDNRLEIARLVANARPDATDLELVTQVILQHGTTYVQRLIGDFAFVIWDDRTGVVIAARDAFGVRRLFYRDEPDLTAFASRAELLSAGDDALDLRALLERAVGHIPSPERTVYSGVRAVPPATTLVLGRGRPEATTYWSADDFAPDSGARIEADEACATFRTLFLEAVRTRLSGDDNTWSQLSGGLDSSSVVSAAQWLQRTGAVPRGVAGTVSWLYRWSTDGDERAFSSVVADHYSVRNEVLPSGWFWEDDGAPPPRTDEPNPDYALWARDRRTCQLVRAAGGRVLLTGIASDQYLTGNMLFFADWIAKGQVRRALREMLRRAVLGRVSFWQLLYEDAILPSLPRSIQRRMVPNAALPAWIPASVASRFDLHDTAALGSYTGPVGAKYRTAVLHDMTGIPLLLGRHAVLEDALDVRHPFLHRPLVEFALRLPAEMCVQPHARKWVLRQAMRDILPERVRSRVGKGGNGGCSHQSLIHERRTITALLKDPLLAQFGGIDPVPLRAAYETACRTGAQDVVGAVVYTCALETWLRVRSGRWVAEHDRSNQQQVAMTDRTSFIHV